MTVGNVCFAGVAYDELVNPVKPEGIAKVAAGKQLSFPQLVGSATKILLGLMGIFALIAFIYGGFTYLFAFGNPEKVKNGSKILMYAVIGLIVSFGSYALVSFITNALNVPVEEKEDSKEKKSSYLINIYDYKV